MKISIRKLIICLILLSFTVLFIDALDLSLFHATTGSSPSPLIVLSFLINGFLSSALLSSSLSQDGISLRVVFFSLISYSSS
jgi:uncharacterized integral membrane protein